MKIFFLAGQSFSNKEWIEKVEKTFKKENLNTKILYYNHWETEKEPDLGKETKRFLELVNNSKEEYLVFAKSMGTAIFFNSMKDLKKYPKDVLMVGVPYILTGKIAYEFKKDMDFKIRIFQKELDPAGSLEEVKEFSNKNVIVKKYECEKEENDNHKYMNLRYLKKLLGY